ncbi:MAG TPA: hypothetical protein VFJ47_08545 [Terriglobales bacterium]|nr:hypothetical protein [Terriglobales bacterium]
MKALTLAVVFCALLAVGVAHGQSGDVAFGVSTVVAPSASSASGNYYPQSVGGGAFPVFSGDIIFFKHQFGISTNISWRASQGQYTTFQLFGGTLQPLTLTPYRPIFYDFNGIWTPNRLKRVVPQLEGGIGAESVRFYQPFFSCGFTGCTNYTSSNHFLGHFGGGVKLYVKGGFFVRPEAHLYLVHNNTEFSSGRAERFGVSIGYTIRPLE